MFKHVESPYTRSVMAYTAPTCLCRRKIEYMSGGNARVYLTKSPIFEIPGSCRLLLRYGLKILLGWVCRLVAIWALIANSNIPMIYLTHALSCLFRLWHVAQSNDDKFAHTSAFYRLEKVDSSHDFFVPYDGAWYG